MMARRSMERFARTCYGVQFTFWKVVGEVNTDVSG
jgi:hypothetical protein